MQFANGFVVEYDTEADIDTSTPSWTELGEIYDVSGPSLSADALDGTAHGDSWRQFVGGLKDGGEVTLGIRMKTDEDTHQEVRDEIGNKFLWRVRFPESAGSVTQPLEVKFDAVMTGWEPAGPHDDLLDLSVTLKVSGQPAWTDES